MVAGPVRLEGIRYAKFKLKFLKPKKNNPEEMRTPTAVRSQLKTNCNQRGM